MYSILFPGQGSQYVGMGSDLYKKFDLVKDIFKRVDQTLGFSLTKIILEGPDNELVLTKNTQPAIMTVGVSIYRVLQKEFGIDLSRAKFFAGHSLGEYTALVCANSIKLETAAYLLHERGKAMQESVLVGKGAMLAVLGMDLEDLLLEIKSTRKENGICEIANDNCPGQIVVSGDKIVINELLENIKKKSKKGVLLPVSAPFHCSLMQKASDIMSKKINESEFATPKPKIISNVSANEEDNVEKIKKLLINQITSKVRWRESIEYMISNKVENFIEIGPGKVLSGLVKRVNKNMITKNLRNVEEIENFVKNDKF